MAKSYVVVSNINAILVFCDYLGDEAKLRIKVKETFDAISHIGSTNYGDLTNILDVQGIPSDLREMVVSYIGNTAKRSAENYQGYLIAQAIAEKVKQNSSPSDTPENRQKHSQKIYSTLTSMEIYVAICGRDTKYDQSLYRMFSK